MRTAMSKMKRNQHTFSLETEETNVLVDAMQKFVPAERTENSCNVPNTLTISMGKQQITHERPFRQREDSTVRGYKQALTAERRRLLTWSRPHPPHRYDAFTSMEALTNHPIIEIGSDGSLRELEGTFGYGISINGTTFWEGAGPADGDPSTANSKRPELYGYAGALESCLMLLQLGREQGLMLPQTITIRTWIDSTSALRHLCKLLSRKKLKCCYPQDADILAHIQWLWSELPCLQEIKWVKAH
jgi:hypothetical protein